MIGGINEKRHFPRIPLDAFLRYEIRGRASEFNHGLCSNISQDGICFTSDIFVATNQVLMFEILLQTNAVHPIGVTSWVTRMSTSGRYRIGAHFVECDSSEKKYLSDYLKGKFEYQNNNV